jgi:hypothetical protein
MQIIEVIASANFIGQEGHVVKHARLRVTEARARYLIEHGLARLAPVAAAGPSENKMAVPQEDKTGAGKSFGEQTTGPSIGSPSSPAPGPETPASASPAAPATPVRRRRRSPPPGSDLVGEASAPLQ